MLAQKITIQILAASARSANKIRLNPYKPRVLYRGHFKNILFQYVNNIFLYSIRGPRAPKGMNFQEKSTCGFLKIYFRFLVTWKLWFTQDCRATMFSKKRYVLQPHDGIICH